MTATRSVGMLTPVVLALASLVACSQPPDDLPSSTGSDALAPAAPKEADIYVYDGPTATRKGQSCHDCAVAAATVARGVGYSVEFITADQVTAANLSRTNLFLWPGGKDDSDKDFDEFVAVNPKAHARQNLDELKTWIQQGGKYLGICLGAYLAAGETPDAKTGKVFDILNGVTADEERPNPKTKKTDEIAHPLLVSFGPPDNLSEPHVVYYQGGPNFSVAKPGVPQEVWARYRTSDRIAAMVTTFGSGTVGVVGPHFEALTDWYTKDCAPVDDQYPCTSAPGALETLADRDHENHMFFGSFIKRVIGY
jgi:glutamine amidotransferase-like uncharacterized protein